MTNYAATDRVLSISFTRDPAEHATAMLDAGYRMAAEADGGMAWGKAVAAALGFGISVGVVMELYRRFVLPLIFDPSDVAPLGTAALELLPLLLLVVALYFYLFRRAATRRRRALIARLQPGMLIDVDVFTQGIRMSSEFFTIEYDWLGARDIIAVPEGMAIDFESSAIFIPERAFGDRAAFLDAGKQMRALRREAVKRNHESKLIAAGLD